MFSISRPIAPNHHDYDEHYIISLNVSLIRAIRYPIA